MVDDLNEASQQYELKLDIEKTEVMGVTKTSEPLTVGINLRGVILRKRNSFRYMGSLVDEDARSACDVKVRDGMTKVTFRQPSKNLVSLSMGRAPTVRVLKAYVWSVLLFGCEVWTISKEMSRRLGATEMWFYKRMMRIP